MKKNILAIVALVFFSAASMADSISGTAVGYACPGTYRAKKCVQLTVASGKKFTVVVNSYGEPAEEIFYIFDGQFDVNGVFFVDQPIQSMQ